MIVSWVPVVFCSGSTNGLVARQLYYYYWCSYHPTPPVAPSRDTKPLVPSTYIQQTATGAPDHYSITTSGHVANLSGEQRGSQRASPGVVLASSPRSFVASLFSTLALPHCFALFLRSLPARRIRRSFVHQVGLIIPRKEAHERYLAWYACVHTVSLHLHPASSW